MIDNILGVMMMHWYLLPRKFGSSLLPGIRKDEVADPHFVKYRAEPAETRNRASAPTDAGNVGTRLATGNNDPANRTVVFCNLHHYCLN